MFNIKTSLETDSSTLSVTIENVDLLLNLCIVRVYALYYSIILYRQCISNGSFKGIYIYVLHISNGRFLLHKIVAKFTKKIGV